MTTKLFLLLAISITISAQTQAPDAVFLNDAQIRRLNETEQRITLARKELEAALEVQKRVIAEIQLELDAPPARFEPLSVIEGKVGFKRKPVEKTDSVKK